MNSDKAQRSNIYVEDLRKKYGPILETLACPYQKGSLALRGTVSGVIRASILLD